MATCTKCGANIDAAGDVLCASCASSLGADLAGAAPASFSAGKLGALPGVSEVPGLPDVAGLGGLPDVRASAMQASVLAEMTRAHLDDQAIAATHDHREVGRYRVRPELQPYSVVLHGDEVLVLGLIDRKVAIERFGQDGSRRGMLGPFEVGDGPDQIGEPAGIALDSQGRLFILDADACRVQQIDESGRVIASHGCEGEGEGELSYPRDLEITDHHMYLADTHRIQRWTRSGDHDLTIGRMAGRGGDDDDDYDDDDECYEDEGAVAGSGEGEFDGPLGVTADDRGNIYVADTNNHRIQVFDRDGQFLHEFGAEGVGRGELSYPGDVRVSDDGHVFVLDCHGRRVQKFDANGGLIYGVVIGDEGIDIGDIDIGEDESIYVPVPRAHAVLRYQRVER